MTSAIPATPLKLPSRDEFGIEDILDSTNMSEGKLTFRFTLTHRCSFYIANQLPEDVTSLRASIARAISKVQPGTDFFDLPWFRVLAAQKTINSLMSFQHDLQRSPVNLKSNDPALAPYDEWVRAMKETVDVSQQQMEAGLDARQETKKEAKNQQQRGVEKKAGAVDGGEKAEFSGMGRGFAKGFAGGLERKKRHGQIQPGGKVADTGTLGSATNKENNVEGKMQAKAKARGAGSLASRLAAAFASSDFIHDVDESEPVVEMGRQSEAKPQWDDRDGKKKKKRKPNTLGRKIARAFAAGLGSDLEVREAAKAEHSTLERQASVATKKRGEAAAHFKGWRVVAREVEASMIARQQWPKPCTAKKVLVTKPVRGISTQKGMYKLEWPAISGWGPRTDGTTNSIEK